MCELKVDDERLVNCAIIKCKRDQNGKRDDWRM